MATCIRCGREAMPGKVFCHRCVHSKSILLVLFLFMSLTVNAQDVIVQYHEAYYPENSGMEVITKTPLGNDTMFYFEEYLTSFSEASLKLRLDIESSSYMRIKAASEDGLHLQWNNVHYKITRRWYKGTRYYFLHSEVLDTVYLSTTMSAMIRLAQERADNHYGRTVINR